MVCGTRSLIGLAQSDLTDFYSLDSWSVADSNAMLAVVASVGATCLALGIASAHSRRRADACRVVANEGIFGKTERATNDRHGRSLLIEELIRSARIAEREGIAALSHPLHRSSDPDVQYAIDLVCARADPRIIRGVLIGRAPIGETPTTSSTARVPLVHARRYLSFASAILLTVVCTLWITAWVIDANLLARISWMLFAGWCVSASLWCLSLATKAPACLSARELETVASKHELILAAAESIANGGAPDQLEVALRRIESQMQHAGSTPAAAA